jgi:hypothetical protein
MKKIMILSAIALSSFMVSKAQAQVRFNVNINIGSQPAWVANTDQADYYYMPDIDCYYSVPERVYVYREGNNWRRAPKLPARYGNYDFRNKRVISIRGEKQPYLRDHRNDFARANDRYNRRDVARNDHHGNDRRNDWNNDRRGGRH